MRSIPKGINLDERDLKLFSYLHAAKVATYDQISRDIYPDLKPDTTGWRIRKLEDAKYIDVGRNRLLRRGKRYVYLRKTTFDDFVRKGHELRLELKSDAVEHDLTLVDIRSKFLKSPKTCAYQTENEIQTWNIKHKHLNSDAMVRSQLKQSQIEMPIEYESSLKKAERYEGFVRKYYQADEFPLLLFIADSQAIIETVIKTEKQLFNWEKPKLFYAMTQTLLSDDSMKFKNCNGFALTLGATESAPVALG